MVEFDKDLDEHMQFVTAASNLRARVYKIPEADMHRSRQKNYSSNCYNHRTGTFPILEISTIRFWKFVIIWNSGKHGGPGGLSSNISMISFSFTVFNFLFKILPFDGYDLGWPTKFDCLQHNIKKAIEI